LPAKFARLADTLRKPNPKGKRTLRKPSKLEQQMAAMLSQIEIVPTAAEHMFHPERRWRFDFAWPSLKVAVEVEGGTWSGGRHTRGAGFEADAEKYNAAAELGWVVLRYTGGMIRKRPAEVLRQVATVLSNARVYTRNGRYQPSGPVPCCLCGGSPCECAALRNFKCPLCRGRGRVAGYDANATETCGACNGTGKEASR
jgi:very-short-patch-repair endonuclease